jgi:hypothetical protein
MMSTRAVTLAPGGTSLSSALPSALRSFQGVDTVNDMLVYACAGLTAEPPKLKGHGTQHQHHHHHHHRHLSAVPPKTAASTSDFMVSPGSLHGLSSGSS